MTTQEFDILDELYFLAAYKELIETCSFSETNLNKSLWQMIKKGWVLCHRSSDIEITPTKAEFESEFGNYHYLASKKGLLAHNAR